MSNKGQRIGYSRVSSVTQNTARQFVDMPLDRIFEDKVSGKDMNRPALQEALAYVRSGDTLVVWSMDRLARNLSDLETIVKGLIAKGVTVEFVKERLTYGPGVENAMSTLLLQIMGSFSQFERSLIRERQQEGIAIARKNNLFDGRERILNDDNVRMLIDRIEAGLPLTRAARDVSWLGLKRKDGTPITSISRATLIKERHSYINKYPAIVATYPRLARWLNEKEEDEAHGDDHRNDPAVAGERVS